MAAQTKQEILLVVVFAIFMAGTFGFGLDLISTLIPDIKQEFELTSGEVGWLTGIGRFGFVVGSILAGLIVSVLAPTLVVVLAVGGCALMWLLLGAADSVVVAALAMLMSSVFTALSWVPMTGVFALFINESNRAKAFGAIIAGSGIGTSLAGYLSPFFINNYSWRAALFAAAGATFIALLLGLRVIFRSGLLQIKNKTNEVNSILTPRRYMNRRVAGIMLMFFLVGYAVHPFQIFLAAYLRLELLQSATVAGNTWLTIGLVGTWGGLFMGSLADKFGGVKIMLLACLLLLASVAVLINLHAPIWFIASAFMFSLAYYCMPGLLPAFLSVQYPPHISTRMFSAGSMMLGIGAVAGNIIGGQLADYFYTLESYYWTCAAVAIVLALLAVIFMRGEKRK